MKQPEIEQRLRILSDALSDTFHGYGHMVLLFDPKKTGTTYYVSNARRKDMVEALRMCANVLEEQQGMPVQADVSTRLQ